MGESEKNKVGIFLSFPKKILSLYRVLVSIPLIFGIELKWESSDLLFKTRILELFPQL
jgi:hypothetical protein